MLFNSGIFLFLYLPFFLLVYYLLPKYWHNAFLFIASLFFYTWGEGPIVLVLLLSIVINYLAGRFIEQGQRKMGLGLSLFGSLSLLIYYKYVNFLADSFSSVGDVIGFPIAGYLTLSHIALPIGISFYTFQGISYTLDIYWGRIRASKSFLAYGTYVAMFPHQIAGPIVRYADIAPELAERSTDLEKFSVGVERFIVGLAKKVLLANTFASVADGIFNAPSDSYLTATAWLGIVAYSLQIYFDFSGYSDMAIGLGKMVGFDFKENFNYPYVARSIQNFWQRWHISLSSWFRDYVYIPLGGNRGNRARTYRNLLIVFFITGLWHGASWNFVIWGLYHGVFLLVERAGFGKRLKNTWPFFAHVYTLLIVMIGWVFFRVENLTDAMAYLKKMAGLTTSVTSAVTYPVAHFLSTEVVVSLLIGIVLATPVYTHFQREWGYLSSRLVSVRFLFDSIYVIGLFGLFVLSVMYLAADTYNPFIYFRF